MANVGNAAEQLMRCTDELIEALPQDSTTATDSRITTFTSAFDDRLKAVETLWERSQLRRNAAAGDAERNACARAWITPYVDRKLFHRIEVLLVTARGQVAVATDESSPAASRCNAALIATYASRAATTLLEYVCAAATDLKANSKGDMELIRNTLSYLAQRSFMSAVADAARGLAAIAAPLPSDAAGARGPGQDASSRSALRNGLFSTTGAALARYTALTGQMMVDLLSSWGPGGGGARELMGAVLKAVSQLVGALAETQLLSAAASAVVDRPQTAANSTLPPDVTDMIYSDVRCASIHTAAAMFMFTLSRTYLLDGMGREGWRLAAVLLRVLRHEAVQRLQVALLDQMAAHAGLGAELGPTGQEVQLERPGQQGQDVEAQGSGQRTAQQQQQQQQRQQLAGPAEAWTGSSGAWWFAREEAERGQLLGLGEGVAGQGPEAQTRSSTAGWLENYHCNIVFSTLCEWAVTDELAEGTGVRAWPPPLLTARLAARAAEALCRLCRGEGLDGAYAPAPQWQFVAAETLVAHLVPTVYEAVMHSVAMARACMPYWLEAAGWAAALMSDGMAAAMGRLPATQRSGTPRGTHVLAMVKEGAEASTLQRILADIGPRASRDSYGVKTLSASAQADVRRRLFRCGLAATLDHTLRLLFSAQDSGLTGIAKLLRRATTAKASVFQLSMAPLLPLPEAVAAPAGDGTGNSDAAAESGSGAGAGGVGSTDQIGLLYTLSKRATMLTRALEAGAGVEAEAAGDEGRRQVTEYAAEVVSFLTAAMQGVEGELGRRVQATRAAAAAAAAEAGDGGVDGATTCHTNMAVCVDEAHEALALAARAACNLAAPLAWQLTADRAAAPARGPAVRLPRARGTQAAVQDRGMDWCGPLGQTAIRKLLQCMVGWWRPPLLLPPAHLLACQPHRLLAAACALAAALPKPELNEQELDVAICALVPILSSHKTLSGHVRSWLAPRPPPGASCSTSNASGSDACGTDGDPYAGCLEAPVKSIIRRTHSRAPTVALRAEALLRIVAGEIAPKAGVQCCEGGRDATGEADGGFQQCAAAMVEMAMQRCDGPSSPVDPVTVALQEPFLPDGSKATDLLVQEAGGTGTIPPPPPPSVPSSPLPPPLAQLPESSLALPRLRMCGNPRCGNFEGDCEGALPLKQCGACRAVRYCGPDCQRGHWREGHKAECKELAARVAKQAAVGL